MQHPDPESPLALFCELQEAYARLSSPLARDGEGVLTDYGTAANKAVENILCRLYVTEGSTIADALALNSMAWNAMEIFSTGMMRGQFVDWNGVVLALRLMNRTQLCLQRLAGADLPAIEAAMMPVNAPPPKSLDVH